MTGEEAAALRQELLEVKRERDAALEALAACEDRLRIIHVTSAPRPLTD